MGPAPSRRQGALAMMAAANGRSRSIHASTKANALAPRRPASVSRSMPASLAASSMTETVLKQNGSSTYAAASLLGT
ncbi:unnamed protein product, partial [Ixodes pacificus]